MSSLVPSTPPDTANHTPIDVDIDSEGGDEDGDSDGDGDDDGDGVDFVDGAGSDSTVRPIASASPIGVEVAVASGSGSGSAHEIASASASTSAATGDASRPLKRPRSPTTLPAAPAPAASGGDDEDGHICLICYDAFSKEGAHRIVCLPCGHLLGESCAKKWLTQKKNCPMCNVRAKFDKCRRVYGVPSRLLVVEKPELDAMSARNAELEELLARSEARRKAVERESNTRTRALLAQVALLKKRAAPASVSVLGENRHLLPRLVADECRIAEGVDISFQTATSGGSGVDFDAAGSVVFSENGSTPGTTCLRRVSVANPNVRMVSTNFSGARVVCIAVCRSPSSPYKSFIAFVSSGAPAGAASSTSPAQLLRVYDSDFNQCKSYRLSAAPRSCCWLEGRQNLLLVGLVTGGILVFDLASSSRTEVAASRLPGGRGSPAVLSLLSLASGNIVAVSARCAALVTFGHPSDAGLSMDISNITGTEGCASGASSSGDDFVLSSQTGSEGSHALYSVAALRSNGGELTLGSENGSRLIGHEVGERQSPLQPLQRATLIQTSRETVVVSSDGNGAMVWRSEMSGEWLSSKLEQSVVKGPVRGAASLRLSNASRSRHSSPVSKRPYVALLSDSQLTMLRVGRESRR